MSPVIWVDADSCPAGVRGTVERAANRRRFETRFVSDRPLPVTETDLCRLVIVEPGPDAADDAIVASLSPGDLVVTRDVELTRRSCEIGAVVLDTEGNRYDANNIGERAAVHELLSHLRESGVETRGPGSRPHRSNTPFANAFDRELTRFERERRDGATG